MKDAYYFPHDSNAKDDPKCVLLIEQLGLEGYGIFWLLVETLRDQPDYRYPLILLPALARRYNTTAEKMKAVVTQYSLFTITDDGDFFFSASLTRRMESFDRKREAGRIGGKKSAAMRLLQGISKVPSTNLQPTSKVPSTSKVNKSKVKESKEKESIEKKAPDKPAHRAQMFIPPPLEEVKEYCSDRNKGVDPEKWYDHYQANGWMVGRTKMKDWKASVRYWEHGDYSKAQSANSKKPGNMPTFDIDEYDRQSLYDTQEGSK